MTLELGALGRETLEEQAGGHRLSVPALLRHSALYYLSERDAGRLAWRVPQFARSAAGNDREGRLEVVLELDDDVWRSLEAESERQRVPLDQLLVHAAFYFMNDLASVSAPSEHNRPFGSAGPSVSRSTRGRVSER
jgi:hypothetical protein